MDTIRKAIAQRQQANVEILQILGEAVMKYPDLRFGQILTILDIIQYQRDPASFDIIGIKDPFNEESVVTLQRVDNKMDSLIKMMHKNH